MESCQPFAVPPFPVAALSAFRLSCIRPRWRHIAFPPTKRDDYRLGFRRISSNRPASGARLNNWSLDLLEESKHPFFFKVRPLKDPFLQHRSFSPSLLLGGRFWIDSKKWVACLCKFKPWRGERRMRPSSLFTMRSKTQCRQLKPLRSSSRPDSPSLATGTERPCWGSMFHQRPEADRWLRRPSWTLKRRMMRWEMWVVFRSVEHVGAFYVSSYVCACAKVLMLFLIQSKLLITEGKIISLDDELFLAATLWQSC